MLLPLEYGIPKGKPEILVCCKGSFGRNLGEKNLAIDKLLDTYDVYAETKGELTGFWNRVKLKPSAVFVKVAPMKALYAI